MSKELEVNFDVDKSKGVEVRPFFLKSLIALLAISFFILQSVAPDLLQVYVLNDIGIYLIAILQTIVFVWMSNIVRSQERKKLVVVTSRNGLKYWFPYWIKDLLRFYKLEVKQTSGKDNWNYGILKSVLYRCLFIVYWFHAYLYIGLYVVTLMTGFSGFDEFFSKWQIFMLWGFIPLPILWNTTGNISANLIYLYLYYTQTNWICASLTHRNFKITDYTHNLLNALMKHTIFKNATTVKAKRVDANTYVVTSDALMATGKIVEVTEHISNGLRIKKPNTGLLGLKKITSGEFQYRIDSLNIVRDANGLLRSNVNYNEVLPLPEWNSDGTYNLSHRYTIALGKSGREVHRVNLVNRCHMAAVGPSGFGKTGIVVNMMRQINLMDDCLFVIIDFVKKGISYQPFTRSTADIHEKMKSKDGFTMSEFHKDFQSMERLPNVIIIKSIQEFERFLDAADYEFDQRNKLLSMYSAYDIQNIIDLESSKKANVNPRENPKGKFRMVLVFDEYWVYKTEIVLQDKRHEQLIKRFDNFVNYIRYLKGTVILASQRAVLDKMPGRNEFTWCSGARRAENSYIIEQEVDYGVPVTGLYAHNQDMAASFSCSPWVPTQVLSGEMVNVWNKKISKENKRDIRRFEARYQREIQPSSYHIVNEGRINLLKNKRILLPNKDTSKNEITGNTGRLKVGNYN